jgi:hypothetical protein
MSWHQVNGVVKPGHGVASGKSGDSRFPNGTIEMQQPFFKARGLDLDRYYSGTINVSISPYRYSIEQSKYTFRDIKWCASEPSEDFSFFDCQIVLNNGTKLEGLIYYPHPDTKPEHFQDPDVLEIMTEPIDGLQYGDTLSLHIAGMQIFKST